MKKFLPSRALLFLGGALLIAVPTSVLLPGCGGGGSSSTPSIDVFTAPVQLSATQSGALTVNVSSTGAITGSLLVRAPVATTQAAAKPGTSTSNALPVIIPAGIYALRGIFTPPRGFTLTGDFPTSFGSFTVTGQIPTSTDAGNYTLTSGTATVSGTFSSANTTPIPTTTGTPTGTVTPGPTATPLPAAVGLRLIYSQNVNANNHPITSTIPASFGSANISGGILTCIFEEGVGNTDPRHSLQFELRGQGPLTAGKSYPMTGTTGVDYFEIFDSSLKNLKWESTGGTIRILSVGPIVNNTSTISLSIVGGRFKASSGFTSTGTFQLDGTAKIVATVGSGAG